MKNSHNIMQTGIAIGSAVGLEIGVAIIGFTPLLAVWTAIEALLGRSVVNLLLKTKKK
jgi:hypothetical protein